MRKTMIITDPIHQVMNLGSDPRLRKCFTDVVDTKAFQRLRRISQLGLASYVFPGATHTRFCHSLGAAYLAHTVLAHLREWAAPKDKGEIDRVFRSVVIAALLHDVGHGPFSHSFERILKGKKCEVSHEDWTAAFIAREESEICRKLRSNGIDVDSVASIFAKDAASKLARPYQQIVSSQLDVDRMDYLVRDSHFAGVAIGRFDVHYLIHSIVIVRHGKDGTRTLGITPKGVKAYEAFLLARQLMNRTVYYHHKVKVLEFMMEHFLRLAVERLDELRRHRSIAPFVPPYLNRVAAAVRAGTDKAALIDKGFRDFVRLTEDNVWSLVAAVAESRAVPGMRRIAEKLLVRKVFRYWVVRTGKGDLLDEALARNGLVEDRDFHVLDLKSVMYKADGDERVFVVGWKNGIEDVGGHSDTISAFRDRPEAESLLICINADKEAAIRDVGVRGNFVIER